MLVTRLPNLQPPLQPLLRLFWKEELKPDESGLVCPLLGSVWRVLFHRQNLIRRHLLAGTLPSQMDGASSGRTELDGQNSI